MQTVQRLHPALFAEHRMDSVWWDWLVNRLAASAAWNPQVRGALLRRAGIEVGTTQVEPGCFFFSDRIEFGDGGKHLLGPGGVTRVDAHTVRGMRNVGEGDAVVVAAGGKDGYVGRDGRTPEGVTERVRGPE